MELYCDAHDALSDVKRSKMKCKQLDSQWDDCKKLMEEKNIDRDYQRMMRFMLGKADMYKKHKRERDNVIIIDEEDPGASLVQNQHESDVQALYSRECNMALNQYVDQAQRGEKDQRKLKKVVVGTNMVKGGHEALKKRPVVKIDTEHLIEYLHEHGKQARATKKRKIYQRRKWNVVKEKNFVKDDHEPEKKAVVRIDSQHLYKKPCLRENRVTENSCKYADKVQPVEEQKVQPVERQKGKNVIRGDHEANRKAMVQIDSMNFYQKPGPRNNRVTNDHCERVYQVQLGKKDGVRGQEELVKVGQGTNLVQRDAGLSSQKITFRKYDAKDELDHNVKAQSGRKRTHCETMNAKAAKCSVAHKKNSDESNMEKEGDDEIDPDVEILENAAFLKNLSSFVPSKRFHKSMEDAESHHLGTTSVCDGFRKKLLDVLKKPFDPEELKRHREAVRDGSYYYYYPDLERKVKRCRYKRGKCLNIFRGFFFWLQNASQEGIFKPWKDGQCLAVEPGSSKISPAPHSTNLDHAKKSNRKILK